MSPESQGPQLQKPTQENPETTSVFQMRSNHPEKVAPFPESLDQMAVETKDGELVTNLDIDPEHPGAINPHTLELHQVDKVDPITPQVEKTSLSKTHKIIAGIVGALMLGGGGATGYAALSHSEQAEQTVAAPDNAGQNNDKPTTDKLEEAPAPATAETDKYQDFDLNRIAGTPTPEQIDAATHKVVTVEQYPTADQALVEFGNILNVYSKSGIVEVVGDHLALTPETEAQGKAILENVYGPYLTPELEAGHREFRTDWSGAINFTPYPELMLYNQPDASTMRELGDGRWQIENNEMHDDSIPNNMNRGTDFRELDTLVNDGKRWYLQDQQFISELN